MERGPFGNQRITPAGEERVEGGVVDGGQRAQHQVEERQRLLAAHLAEDGHRLDDVVADQREPHLERGAEVGGGRVAAGPTGILQRARGALDRIRDIGMRAVGHDHGEHGWLDALGEVRGAVARIAVARAAQQIERDAEVGDAAGHRSGRVHPRDRRRRRGRDDRHVGDAAPRDLQRQDAARGGGDADRSTEVGADSERAHAGGQRHRFPTARAAGRRVGVPRVDRRAREAAVGVPAQRDVGHVRATDDDRARLAESLHRRTVLGRDRVLECLQSERRRAARDVDVLLDRDGHAVERATRLPRRDRAVGCIGLRTRRLREHFDDRVHAAVHRVDAVEMGVDDFSARRLARADEARQLPCGHLPELGHTRHSPCPHARMRRVITPGRRRRGPRH